MLRKTLFVVCLTTSIGCAFAQDAPVLEVMGIRPGSSSILDAKAIIEPHTKKLSCKDKKSIRAHECRTKGEKDSLTLAGEKVTVAFLSSMGATDSDKLTSAVFTFDDQGPSSKAEEARRIVLAYTSKYGEPASRQNCVVRDQEGTLQRDENTVVPCATWVDDSGVRLTVLYRVQHDVLSAFGDGVSADHLIEVEIADTSILNNDL